MQTKANQFEAEAVEMAQQAKALSHPARLAILQVLAERSECICGEIVDDLPLAQSTVSRHLKVLKEAGLVRGTVDGPSVCYCLAPEAISALRDRFGAFLGGLSEAAGRTSC